MSASIGGAWRPRDGVDLGELFRLADQRMYATKRRLRDGQGPTRRNHLDVRGGANGGSVGKHGTPAGA